MAAEKGLPAWLALLLTIFLIFGVGILLLVFIGTAMSELAEALPSYQTNAQEQSASLQESLANRGINAESVIDLFNPERIFELLGNILAEVISAGVATVFMLFILAFMLFETLGISKKLRGPKISENQFIKRFTTFGADIRQYVLVLTWINFLVGLGDAIFLSVLGVDFAILWGLLAWDMGYIPSAGFWLALIPPFLLAYAESGIGTALLVLLGYVLINGTAQNVIQPKLMGDRLNMSPLGEIETPTLVMAGREDFQFPPEHQAIMADRLPNAQLKIIERAGHNAPMERTAKVIEALKRFMDGVNSN